MSEGKTESRVGSAQHMLAANKALAIGRDRKCTILFMVDLGSIGWHFFVSIEASSSSARKVSPYCVSQAF